MTHEALQTPLWCRVASYRTARIELRWSIVRRMQDLSSRSIRIAGSARAGHLTYHPIRASREDPRFIQICVQGILSRHA